MKKIIQFFNSPFFSPVAINFLLYICWLLTININESLLTGLILFPIYLTGTVFAKLSEKHWGFYLLTFFLLSISIYTVGQKFLAEVLFTVDVGINSYIWGGFLAITLFFVYLANTFEGKVSINKKTAMSLFLFIATLPFFVLNFGYYLPKLISERARLGQYTYLIFDSQDSDLHPYLAFYKCARWEFKCKHLYNSYSATIGWKIIIDEQKNEVSLFDEIIAGFLYTDGETPRVYSGEGGKLHDHLYSLSEKCNNPTKHESYVDCESYSYIPYKCNMNGVLCNSIPIRYTTNDSGYNHYYYWVGNDLQSEISLYDMDDMGDRNKDILIFTYGVHPRCYVDGCEILEQDSVEP
jgi:hypothetical protein